MRTNIGNIIRYFRYKKTASKVKEGESIRPFRRGNWRGVSVTVDDD